MAQQRGEAGAVRPPAVEVTGIVVAGHAAEGGQHRSNTGVLDALHHGVAAAPRVVYLRAENVSSGNLARRTLHQFTGHGGPPDVAVAPPAVYVGLDAVYDLQGAGRGEVVPVAGVVQGDPRAVFLSLAEFVPQNPLPGAGHGGHPAAAVAPGLPGAVSIDLAEITQYQIRPGAVVRVAGVVQSDPGAAFDFDASADFILGTGRGGGEELELASLLHGGDPRPAYDNSARQSLVPVAGRGGGEERVGLLPDGSGGNLARQLAGRDGEPVLLIPGGLRARAVYDGSGNLAGLILLPAAAGPDERAVTTLDDGPGAAYVDIGRLERQVHPGAGRGEDPAVDVVQRHPVALRAEGFLTALRDVYRNLGAAYDNFRALAHEIRGVFHRFSTAVGRLRSLLDAVWIIMALSMAVRALVAGVGSPAFGFLLLIVGMVLVILHARRA